MAQLGTCSSDVAAVEKHLILRKSDVMAMGNGIAGPYASLLVSFPWMVQIFGSGADLRRFTRRFRPSEVSCVGKMGCLMGKDEMMGAAGQPGPYMAGQARHGYGGYGYQQQVYDQYAPGRPFCEASSQNPYMPQPPQPYGNEYGMGPYQPRPGYADQGYAYDQQGPGYPPNGYPPNGYPSNGYPSNGYPYQSQDGYMEQRPGMSNGGKMAMAAAGGLALGAGAALAVDHADDIAHFAEEAVEDIGDFARDIF